MNSSNVNSTEIIGEPWELTPKSSDPMISLTVPAVMFASGVAGNVLALIVLARSSRETKKRAFYRLVGALAFTDFLGTCATSPVTLAVYANNLKWLGGMPLCNYESFMLIFAGCSTISIICAMSLDRFVSICHPFVYDKYVTSRRTNGGLLTIWLFAACMGLLPIIGLGENVIQFPGTWCFFTFTSSKVKNQIFAYSYAAICLIAIFVTGVSNMFVTGMLLKMKRRSRQTRAVCYTCTRRQSKETQMLILMVGIIAIFTTCWGPFLIRIIINQANKSQLNVKADLLTLRLASLNQILDPWIYILFRKAFIERGKKLILRAATKCIPGAEEYIKGKELALDGHVNGRNFDFSSENAPVSSEDQETCKDSPVKDDGTPTESRPSSRRPSKKYLKRSRSSMMAAQLQLLNGHTADCPGLKHVTCLYCFTSLPQNFALILGTNVNDPNASSGVSSTECKEKSDIQAKDHGQTEQLYV